MDGYSRFCGVGVIEAVQGRQRKVTSSRLQDRRVAVFVVREADATSHPAWRNETRPGRTRPSRTVLSCKADHDRTFVWGKCTARFCVLWIGDGRNHSQRPSQPSAVERTKRALSRRLGLECWISHACPCYIYHASHAMRAKLPPSFYRARCTLHWCECMCLLEGGGHAKRTTLGWRRSGPFDLSCAHDSARLPFRIGL